MSAANDLIARCRVPEGKKVQLKDYDTDWAGDPNVPKSERKRYAEQSLTQDVSELAEAQERLYAADSWSILMIFQAMDAAGKDGTIKHVMSGVNPQGCQVFSFKKPSAEELDHNFLWRYTRALPERGRIGIFNRDGTRLLGGILVGDASDYGTLLMHSKSPDPPLCTRLTFRLSTSEGTGYVVRT